MNKRLSLIHTHSTAPPLPEEADNTISSVVHTMERNICCTRKRSERDHYFPNFDVKRREKKKIKALRLNRTLFLTFARSKSFVCAEKKISAGR